MVFVCLFVCVRWAPVSALLPQYIRIHRHVEQQQHASTVLTTVYCLNLNLTEQTAAVFVCVCMGGSLWYVYVVVIHPVAGSFVFSSIYDMHAS